MQKRPLRTFSEKQRDRKKKETFRKLAQNITAGVLGCVAVVGGVGMVLELAKSNPFGGNATVFKSGVAQPLENPPDLAGYKAKTGFHAFNAGALCETFMPQAFRSAYTRTSPLQELYDRAKISGNRDLKDWAHLVDVLRPMKNKLDQAAWVNAFFNARAGEGAENPAIANAESFEIPDLETILTKKINESGPVAFAKAMTLLALGVSGADMSYVAVAVRQGDAMQTNYGRVEHHIVLKVGDMILNNQSFAEPLRLDQKAFSQKGAFMNRLNALSEVATVDAFFDPAPEKETASLNTSTYSPLFEIRVDGGMTSSYESLREFSFPFLNQKIFMAQDPQHGASGENMASFWSISHTETSVERATRILGLVCETPVVLGSSASTTKMKLHVLSQK